jgi:predicted transcriptional regulator
MLCDNKIGIRYMKLIDPTTGQSYTTIGVARKKPFPNGMEFHFLFNDLTRYLISCDLELTGVDYRVMFAMMHHAGWENHIDVSLDMLCEELKMKKPNLSKSIKKLVGVDIIQKVRSNADARQWHYRFNPNFMWKGSVKRWEETMNSESHVTSISSKRKPSTEPIY